MFFKMSICLGGNMAYHSPCCPVIISFAQWRSRFNSEVFIDFVFNGVLIVTRALFPPDGPPLERYGILKLPPWPVTNHNQLQHEPRRSFRSDSALRICAFILAQCANRTNTYTVYNGPYCIIKNVIVFFFKQG